MKRKTKLLLTVLVIIMTILFLGIYRIYYVVTWLKIEDELYHKYSPIILAIRDYEKSEKIAPGTLNELVPEYLEKLPEPDDAESFHYSNKVIKNRWELKIHSRKRNVNRTYVVRSDDYYSENERKSTLKIYHVEWRILEDP